MSNVNGVLARVAVPDLDSAIPLYQALAGVTDLRRFSFRDVELAWVGPFLLLSGNTAPYLDRVATILVNDLAPVISAIGDAGGQILDGPSAAANGARLVARHPDGSTFEYIQSAGAPGSGP
jgi:predicted enzyme related to lactoylglutathione lyase